MKNNTLKLSFAAVASFLILWAGLRAAAQHSPAQHSPAQHSPAQHSPAQSPAPEVTKATAVLIPTEGNNVRGLVTFTQAGANVRVSAHIEGLAPGMHGFHIHEFGDCSSKDGSSAGGHFNPAGAPHAGPDAAQRHAGDMGNIQADRNGVANLEYVDPVAKLSGHGAIVGHGLIVHANPDDMKTQPTGNAGGRVACGVIGVAKP